MSMLVTRPASTSPATTGRPMPSNITSQGSQQPVGHMCRARTQRTNADWHQFPLGVQVVAVRPQRPRLRGGPIVMRPWAERGPLGWRRMTLFSLAKPQATTDRRAPGSHSTCDQRAPVAHAMGVASVIVQSPTHGPWTKVRTRLEHCPPRPINREADPTVCPSGEGLVPAWARDGSTANDCAPRQPSPTRSWERQRPVHEHRVGFFVLRPNNSRITIVRSIAGAGSLAQSITQHEL